MPTHHPMIIIVDRDQADHYQRLAASYDSEHDAAYAREEAEGSVAASNWHAMTEAAEELSAAVGHLFHEPASTLSAHDTAYGLPCPLSAARIDSSAGPNAAGSPCPNGCDTAVILRPHQAEEPLL
jgi:hypothetical protein